MYSLVNTLVALCAATGAAVLLESTRRGIVGRRLDTRLRADGGASPDGH